MKKLTYALALLPLPVLASSGGNQSGAAITTGPSSSHYSIFASVNNPAMAPLMLEDDENWRFTYFPSFSFITELGELDNFADDLDELIDILDTPESTDDPVTEVLDRFNDVLVKMGESGFIKNSISIHAPVTPLYGRIPALDGNFYVDLSANIEIGARILDDTLSYDNQNSKFDTNTSLYLKSGIEKRLTFGFGREIFSNNAHVSKFGTLYAGVALNIINLELSKQVTRLVDLDGEEITDVIEEQYDSNLRSTTNVGIDVGLVLDASRYRVGLTLDNLNSPSFDYGEIGVNCENIAEGNIERNSCEVSRAFTASGRIDATESHTKHALLRADGLLKITNRWLVTSALDLAAYDDLVGFENQWFNLATHYETKGYWLPSARIGYKQNLTGNELSSFGLGFTFFKAVSFDIDWSTESVEVDGNTAPRRFGFAFSFEEKF